MMYETIIIKYIHPGLNIGLADVRTAWLLVPEPLLLSTSVHRGALVYRFPGGKRISYRQLKKGLIKKTLELKQPVHLLPF